MGNDKIREGFEALSINRKAVQHEIEKVVAEMRQTPYICDERFAIAEIPGIQVHIVVTREEEDFLDYVDPAFSAQEPQQPAAVPEPIANAIAILRANLRNPESAMRAGVYDNRTTRKAIDNLLAAVPEAGNG